MPEPISVTISHRLGRAEAKRRIDEGLSRIRDQLAGVVSDTEYHWEADRLNFRVTAMRQTVLGQIEVMDDSVKLEVGLPFLLRMVANKLIGRVQKEGALLLGKPKVS